MSFSRRKQNSRDRRRIGNGCYACMVRLQGCLNRSPIEHQNSNIASLGFSLLEVMVVLVIIGLVAGLVTVGVTSRLSKAKRKTAEIEIRTLMEEVGLYFVEHGKYPTTDQGLETALAEATGDSDALIGVPRDPWGNAYDYTSPGLNAAFEIVSFGADGKEGGSGADADIESWNLEVKDDDDV